MSYTLLLVSDFDPAELARIDLTGITSHDVAVQQIQNHSMGWSGSHERAFADLGVSCYTLVPASEVVRRLITPSAADESSTTSTSVSQLMYVDQAVRQRRPDVVLFENPAFLDRQAIAQLRKGTGSPLLITHFCAALRPEAEANLQDYDLVLCCSPHFVDRAQFRGATATLYYHAAPPAALEQSVVPVQDRLRRACFIGSIVPGSRYHSRRRELLRQVCRAGVPIDIYSDPPSPRLLAALRHRRGQGSRLVQKLEGLHHRLISRSSVHQVLRPPVYGSAMFNTMQHYLCAVNVHAGMAQGCAANMRLFEAASLGVCLISENHPNLPDLFEPGHEVLTYTSSSELIARIRFCMDNPHEACAIGERARQKVLANHRYADRVGALHARLLQLLDQRR